MNKNLLICLVVAPLMLASSLANAYSYGFTQITNNTNTAVSSQLWVDVTNSGGNALFTFTNNVGIASSITEIYFDYDQNYFTSISNNILGSAGQSSGVNFVDGGTPPNLPGGNTIGFTTDAMGESPGNNTNGIDTSTDWVAFLGTLNSANFTFDDVIAGLDGGLFRIGLHVRGIEGGTSDAFVTKAPDPVPLPAAVWLFGSALLGFVSLSKRRKDTN